MAWRVESVMDQRLCFIAACLRADEPMSSLCLRFEISRKTGYKWLSRYHDFGAAGLVPLSSARHTVVQSIDPAINRCRGRVAQAKADLGAAQITGPFVDRSSAG